MPRMADRQHSEVSRNIDLKAKECHTRYPIVRQHIVLVDALHVGQRKQEDVPLVDILLQYSNLQSLLFSASCSCDLKG